MPAISAPSKVLVTGGSGFLGAWVIKDLLERGFQVRAAVRSESKASYLRNLFNEYPDALEFVIVEDITVPHAFDEAVKGVSGIIHSASPLIPRGDPTVDPKKLIEPAVQGTVGILKSAHGSSDIRRVVVTSSIAATWDSSKKLPFVFDEQNWNDAIVKIVAEYGSAAPPEAKYAASKTLAEQGAWEFMESSSPAFDLVTILPSFLWGQVISETTTDIGGSNRVILEAIKEKNMDTDNTLLKETPGVDVRDAAKLHVDSILLPIAGGQRFICSTSTVTNQHIYNILNANPIEGLRVSQGDVNILNDWEPSSSFSNMKSQEVMGMHYRPIEETIRDTVIHALELGWKQ